MSVTDLKAVVLVLVTMLCLTIVDGKFVAKGNG